MTWILINEDENTRDFKSRAEAERVKTEQEELGATIELARLDDSGELVTIEAAGPTDTDDTPETADHNDEPDDFDEIAEKHDVDDAVNLGDAVATANEVAEEKHRSQQLEEQHQQQDTELTTNGDGLPDATNVSEDPISWMPEHFIDVIEGVPAINRKGYAVLAEHYGISTLAEPVTYPSESGFEFAEFRAIARTPDGNEYSGFGSAHVDRGDDKTLLGELAETRAIKRSISCATGVGMIAVSEMKGDEEVVE